MKPNILLSFLIFTIFLSGCGTMKLVDSTEYLSGPLSTTDFWTVSYSDKSELAINSLNDCRITGDSILFSHNLGMKFIQIGELNTITHSKLNRTPKEEIELASMLREGGLLIGGIVGAAAGAAIAGEDFSGKGALYTISGAVAGSVAGYYIGGRIVLNQEKPTLTVVQLSDKTIAERKEILAGLIGKKN